jgi:hypothetical protein
VTLLGTYEYVDEAGALLYCVERYEPKAFKQRAASGAKSLDGVRRVLYRLPQLLAAVERGDDAYFVEGEKDVHAIEAAGAVATCVSGGTGGWRPEFVDHFRGAHVTIVADNDEPGRTFAAKVAGALKPVAASLAVVVARVGKDAYDHFEAGFGLYQFEDITVEALTEAVTQPDDDGWTAPAPIHVVASVPPFPTHVLPPVIADYVEALAEDISVPVDLPGVVALGVLAACAGGHVNIAGRGGQWIEDLNLYVAVAMPPGTGKSPVFKRMLKPLYDAEVDIIKAVEPAYRTHEHDRLMIEHDYEEAIKEAKKAGGIERASKMLYVEQKRAELDALKPVPLPRIIADDVTPEKLAAVLAENGGRLAIMSAEGGVFDIMAGRYSKDGKGNFDVYLKGHAGDQIRVERLNRPPDFVERPSLTICLTVQPDVLVGLGANKAAVGRGLPARFLYSTPVTGDVDVDAEPAPPELAEFYRDYVHALAVRLHLLPEPVLLRMSPEAVEAVQAYRRRVVRGGDGVVRDWTGKVDAHILRLTGLMHVAHGRPLNEQVSAGAVAAAADLMDYFTVHALAVFDAMGADPDLDVARVVGAWLVDHTGETVTKRDIFIGVRSSTLRKVSDLDGALLLLEQHGWIRPVTSPNGSSRHGRPSSPAYEVNPTSARCARSV